MRGAAAVTSLAGSVIVAASLRDGPRFSLLYISVSTRLCICGNAVGRRQCRTGYQG